MTAEDKLKDYQAKAIDFVNLLCDPTATDKAVSWAGAKAVMAFITLTDQMDGWQAGLDRVRRLNPPV